MKTLFLAAAALTLSGSALAYQTYGQAPDAAPDAVVVAIDPTVAFEPPAVWTVEQRELYDAHFANFPAHWTPEQRALYQQQLSLAPINWTAEQRALYHEHLAYLPSTWTAEQRAAYMEQMASLHTPWVATQTAATTVAMAPVGDRIVQPSNANPERDARGIAVISDPAVVPAGYNGFAGTAMGGPLVDPATGEAVVGADASYPPCTAEVTDNCIQLYERGVRASLASSDGTAGSHAGMGGPVGEDELGDNTAEDDLLDVDTKPDGDLDVDADLDNDGDNDLE